MFLYTYHVSSIMFFYICLNVGARSVGDLERMYPNLVLNQQCAPHQLKTPSIGQPLLFSSA